MAREPDGIDLDDPWQAIEVCYERGWTDGLPVVPATEALVEQMLASGPWAPDEVLLHEPARDRAVTAFKAAVNAVLAGCRPEYFPVIGAALTAIGDPGFELHGPATSTGGAALMVIVNGPVRRRLGIQSKANLFGPGFRANATIGRALRLVLLNCLECRPGVLDKSTQGWPGKYSLCFAEDEEASPWEPLSVARGFQPGQSTVTVFAAESGHNVLSHGTRSPERLLTLFAETMAGLGSLSPGRSVVVLAPEHAGHLARERWGRTRIQAWLYERAWRSLADLKRAGKVEPAFLTNPRLLEWLYRHHAAGVPFPPPDPGAAERITAEDETVRVHRGLGPDDILLCVGGGEAGGHSAFFPSWSRGRSVPFITKEVPA
ncbi:MAG TPA: hypothetical protein VNC82_22635 [Candidatus Limnocylindria bacterium]|nr:hypothetical protein [Candidatus Limnocylindria bacterium]